MTSRPENDISEIIFMLSWSWSHALTIPAIENTLQTFRNNSNARG